MSVDIAMTSISMEFASNYRAKHVLILETSNMIQSVTNVTGLLLPFLASQTCISFFRNCYETSELIVVMIFCVAHEAFPPAPPRVAIFTRPVKLAV